MDKQKYDEFMAQKMKENPGADPMDFHEQAQYYAMGYPDGKLIKPENAGIDKPQDDYKPIKVDMLPYGEEELNRRYQKYLATKQQMAQGEPVEPGKQTLQQGREQFVKGYNESGGLSGLKQGVQNLSNLMKNKSKVPQMSLEEYKQLELEKQQEQINTELKRQAMENKQMSKPQLIDDNQMQDINNQAEAKRIADEMEQKMSEDPMDKLKKLKQKKSNVGYNQ